jgi:hypothetical protein
MHSQVEPVGEGQRRFGKTLPAPHVAAGPRALRQVHQHAHLEPRLESSCFRLLSNAVLVWNTVHIDSIVGQLRASGVVRDADLAPVSPLLRQHFTAICICHRTEP